MPLLKIDDKEFQVESGTTVLETAEANGIEIPHYCYHPALEVVGSCRTVSYTHLTLPTTPYV